MIDYLRKLLCEHRVAPNPGSKYPLGPNEVYPIYASNLLLKPRNVVGASHVDPLPNVPGEKTLPFTGRTQEHLMQLDKLSKLPHIPTRAALY